MTQILLPFRRRRPALTPGERLQRTERLLAYLAGRGWVCRRQIELMLGIDDRTIRDIAETSDEIISGNRGYKLFAEATTEEIRECLGRISSQVDKMTARYIRLHNKAHREVGA
jgi:hypothetical protein